MHPCVLLLYTNPDGQFTQLCDVLLYIRGEGHDEQFPIVKLKCNPEEQESQVKVSIFQNFGR